MSSTDVSYDLIFDYLPFERIEVKKMFGHQCIYYDGLMVMFMICKEDNPDNGICLATSKDHIASLKREIKSLRYLEAYGPESTDWRLIPASDDNFENDTERACALIRQNDPRIGRVPKNQKNKRKSKSKK